MERYSNDRARMMLEMEKRFRLGHIYEIELIMRCVYMRSDENHFENIEISAVSDSRSSAAEMFAVNCSHNEIIIIMIKRH